MNMFLQEILYKNVMFIAFLDNILNNDYITEPKSFAQFPVCPST